MSKILVISPVPTHPVTAGNRARIASLTDILQSTGHTVYFMHCQLEAGDAGALRAHWGDRYIPVPYQRPPSQLARRRRRLAKALGLEAAYRRSVDEWYDPTTDAHVDRFLAANHVDAVIVEYVFMSRALLRIPAGALKVIDTHDIFAERHRRYLANGMEPTWFSCSARQEAKGLNRADAVIAIQENEAVYFRRATRARVATIGHPITLQPLPASESVAGRILLVASDNVINLTSVQWFIRSVLPLVRQACPHAELAVAGTVCQRLQSSTGVRLLGRLEDLGSAYAAAQVVVNPMRFGTGLKIKSVEALGHSRALVTTPCGAEGLEAGAGRAFRVAAEPDPFARELVALITDSAATTAVAESGYRFALEINRTIRAGLAALLGDTPEGT